ncbi:response regulator transcription factor [Consotaella salsifontis]|uniref:Regulatory protein VirG n=1 Tax=Consotaella salsifontis TaxID=1365950 RepID=A0A1T4PIJ8_9HYPH|nr:response regulator transcription factor [Consotaella salsifontis]SJZ91390.1 two-component system, OmpR family, response regulator [Consotaella salsifontis]
MTLSGQKVRVAVVDDDTSVREVVCDVLASEGIEALACASAADYLGLAERSESIDLVILDLQLPDRDGFSLAASIRASSAVPIIMLTGRGGELDRILGLEIGADDYVVKPFNARELLARVKAVRRRYIQGGASFEPPPRNGYRFLGHVLDTDRRRLTGPGGEPIPLTVAEFDLLHALVERQGRVLSRDQLLEITHRTTDDIFDRTIDVLILRLRRKIEPNPTNPLLIKTERGHGYVFDVRVEKLSPH